jgi:hypothetical protein
MVEFHIRESVIEFRRFEREGPDVESKLAKGMYTHKLTSSGLLYVHPP